MLNRNQLMNELIVIFDKQLQASLNEAIKLTLNKLFQLAQNADSNQKEQVLFNQYRDLKDQEKRLCQEVREQTKSMPDFISSEVNKSDKKMSLALVEDEELSISLSLTQLDSTLEIGGHTELYLLEKRMNVLFGDERIDKTNMPFSPASIVWLMSHTLKTMNWSEAVKTKLLEALQKSLNNCISETYHQLNERFIVAGILPNLQPEFKRAQSRDSSQKEAEKDSKEEHKKETVEQKSQEKECNENSEGNDQKFSRRKSDQPSSPTPSSPGAPDSGNADEQKLVDSIFKLLSEQQRPKQNNQYASHYHDESDNEDSNSPEQSTGEAPKNEVSGNDFEQALNQLTADSGLIASSHQLSDLKNLLTDRVRNNTGNYYPELSERQHKTIDLLGMIYDEIHEDGRIDNDIRSSLNAINVPLIKTAVKDDTFFSDNKHPARQFMELLLETSQRWYGTDVIKQVHQFSDHAAKDFDGSREGFVKALNELSEFLQTTEKRAQKAEQKWVSAAQGKEKMQITKDKVNEELDAILKDCEIKFVRDVVKHVSKDALTLTMLREGQDSPQWQQNIKTAQVLSQIGNRENFKKLTGPQKLAAMRHLDETMDELGFTKRDRVTAKDNLHTCFSWQESNQESVQADPPKLKKVQSIDQPSKHQTEPESDESNKIEDIRSLNEAERKVVDNIIKIPYGTLFDFKTNQRGDHIRRKLCWVSTVSERVLFVDLAGRHPHKMGLARLAIEMSRNNVVRIEVETGGYVKKALGKIMNRLKKMAA